LKKQLVNIIVLLIGINNFIIGQTGFFKTEAFNLDFGRGNCIAEYNDSTYVGFGKVFQSGWSNRTMGFFVVNSHGDFLKVTPLSDSLEFNNDTHNELFVLDEYVYAVPNGESQINPVLRYDPLSETVETIYSFDNESNSPIFTTDFQKLKDDSFVINLIESVDNIAVNKIVIFNQDSVIITFSHNYNSLNKTELLVNLEVTDGNSLLFHGYKNSNDNSITLNPFLVEYDLEGNKLWEFTFPDTYQYALVQDLISKDDYILMLNNYSPASINSNETRIVKIDKLTGIDWDVPFGVRLGNSNGNELTRIIEAHEEDGFIVAGGIYKFGQSYKSAIIGKISINGDSLWMKTFEHTTNWNDTNVITDIEQLSHRGYIATGNHRYGILDSVPANENWSSIILLKTDNDGTLDFTSSYLSPPSNSRVSIFPNPSNDLITIESNSSFSGVKIFSLNGKLLKSLSFSPSRIINLNLIDLQTGIYIIKLLTKGTAESYKVFKF